ncbi:MAG: hypothetical protein HKN87_17030 [Saprospiraceae bacterium]|nr:hypothetical protein [Saprospiraceae bacterium]
MKSLILIKSFLILMVSGMLLMSFNDVVYQESSDIHTLVIKPDLRVSRISTPGGLCAGIKNKVRVTVTNSQMAGVKKKIPVILFVVQNGQPTTSYVGHSTSGIGPNSNSGIPVYFNNVVVAKTGNVTLRAVVNPDQELLESVYNNNTRVQRVRVARRCNAAKPAVTGKNLTVTMYKSGTWYAGSGDPISGVQVKVRKNGSTIGTGTTAANGKVTIPNIPIGKVTFEITKNGCVAEYYNGYNSYGMPGYNTNVNRAMSCN